MTDKNPRFQPGDVNIVFSSCASDYVPISQGTAPEELLTYLSGGCAKWQIYVTFSSFCMLFVHGLNLYSVDYIIPIEIPYRCRNGTEKCFDSAGKPCKEFYFPKNHWPMVTVNERLLMVCEKEHYAVWIHNSSRIALVLSYLLVGFFADRYGEKVTTILFIPLISLAGLLIICSEDIRTLVASSFFFGLTCSAIHLITTISLCNIVGNKWRTFAMGFTLYPMLLALATLPYMTLVLTSYRAFNTILTMSPLVFLIPLLYFKDSPSWMFVKRNLDSTERVLRLISKFNGMPMSRLVKVRPVGVLDPEVPQKMNVLQLFRYYETGTSFLALLFLWFSSGYVLKIISMKLHYKVIVNSLTFAFLPGLVGLLGCMSGIALCHVVPHKVVMATNLCICYILVGCHYILQIYLFPTNPLSNNYLPKSTLIVLAFFCCWFSYAALDNATPRMFSTDIRSQCLGQCMASYHLGQFVSRLMMPIFENSSFAVVCVFIIFMPSVSLFCSGWMWNVHNRELPELIRDARRFQKYYKPTRFISIENKNVTIDEKEVKSIMY